MEQSLTLVLLYALVPVFCMIIGGLISSSNLPEQTLDVGIQHSAAGVVFAAIALEFLPKVMESKLPWDILFGFLAGLLLMYLVKEISGRLQRSKKKFLVFISSKPHITSVGLDLFIDGILISIAFAAGTKSGILIALALAVEELFLGLSIHRLAVKQVKHIVQVMLLSSIILLGVLSGYGILQLLPDTMMTSILAFGMAALLYLVTEELLLEVHVKLETPWATAMFLIGFLFILMIELIW